MSARNNLQACDIVRELFDKPQLLNYSFRMSDPPAGNLSHSIVAPKILPFAQLTLQTTVVPHYEVRFARTNAVLAIRVDGAAVFVN